MISMFVYITNVQRLKLIKSINECVLFVETCQMTTSSCSWYDQPVYFSEDNNTRVLFEKAVSSVPSDKAR